LRYGNIWATLRVSGRMKVDRKTILEKMPPNLDQLAKDTGALRRRREVKSAEQVPWMVLIYSGLVSSLRETSALAASLGDFDINDTSVRYRLGNAVEFLTAIVNHVLFGSAKILADKGIRRRICLQDATVVTCANNNSSYFRLHTEYVPGQGLAYGQITDQHGAESLKYRHDQPGDIVIADQGLARARFSPRVFDRRLSLDPRVSAEHQAIGYARQAS